MSQEFQGGVCEGNWWMMNSSQNFFRTSPCSSSISDFGWQNHDLVKNLESLSHGNNPQILQEDANYFLHPSMNYTQQNEYSPALQDSSFDSLKNQSVFPANHEQRLNPISSSSEDFAAAYSYDSSALLQHLFDTDSQEHESLLENLGLNYTQAMNCQNTGSFDGGQKDSDTNHLQFGNNMQYWKDSTEFSCDVGASVSRSTTQPQFTASSFSRTKANKISNSTVKHHNEEKKTIINEQPTTAKRSRIETPSPLPSFKVRKEKLGDRITALQQLVSPFGKTDTASVLHEAIDYIKFLHDQVRVLSTPYMKNARGPEQYQQKTDNNNNNKDLKSRGLCVVPISSTFPVATETTADFWTPNFGGNFKR